MSAADIWEALMLILFGASWPTAILKTIRVKNPLGKSRLFLLMVFLGYMAGLVAKFCRPPLDWVALLYVINALMVMTDLIFVIYYKRKVAMAAKAGQPVNQIGNK